MALYDAVWLNSGGERIQEEEENEEASWGRNQEHVGASSLSHFKAPMLESDWFSNQQQQHPQDLHVLQNQQEDFRFLGGFLFNPNDNLLLDSSSSQLFTLDTSQQPSFLPSNNKSCLLSAPSDTNPFDNAFELGSDSCFLGQAFGSLTQGFTPLELQGFTSPAKVLKPLEVLASSVKGRGKHISRGRVANSLYINRDTVTKREISKELTRTLGIVFYAKGNFTMALDGNGGAVWLNSSGEEEASWGGNQEHVGASSLSHFKAPMLESDWFSNQQQQQHTQDLHVLQNQQEDFRFLFNPNDNLLLDSSSSQLFTLDTSQPSFLPSNNKSCLLSAPSDTNPFDNAFELGSGSCFLGQAFGSLTQGFTPLELQGFTSPAKVLKPLEVFTEFSSKIIAGLGDENTVSKSKQHNKIRS
ncbi:hypothetical protein F2Q70_00000192 [Brassica cretica]|uniref:Uncharacterized protein n=1 Tax=Brassica cretica TaxID=69181 RepID=A0A8S9ILL2_BRACR|nr:hypothetical protein F2Q70_00000192 [Brassica cretica]